MANNKIIGTVGDMMDKKAKNLALSEEELAAFEALKSEMNGKSDSKKERKAVLNYTSSKLFLDELEKNNKLLFSKVLKVDSYKSKAKKAGPTKRILNISLSDLHFHSMLDPEEVPLQYGPVEEARRLARIVKQACEYKIEHRDDTELYVHLLGDIIQNQLHDARDGAPLASQCSASIFLLTQAIATLSTAFKKVTVFCTPGNHGRNTARHRDRAVHQKWDSLETIIYSSVKIAVAGLSNVTVLIPKTPYYTFSAFKHKGFGTHGDTVIKTGFPSKNINIAEIRKQINERNSVLDSKDKYSLFIVGHVHTGSCVHLPNGSIFMSNGCLIPPDPYAVSEGIMDTACGQWMWESVPDHIVGDHRFVRVSEDDDKDSSLDSIIKPFLSF